MNNNYFMIMVICVFISTSFYVTQFHKEEIKTKEVVLILDKPTGYETKTNYVTERYICDHNNNCKLEILKDNVILLKQK